MAYGRSFSLETGHRSIIYDSLRDIKHRQTPSAISKKLILLQVSPSSSLPPLSLSLSISFKRTAWPRSKTLMTNSSIPDRVGRCFKNAPPRDSTFPGELSKPVYDDVTSGV